MTLRMPKEVKSLFDFAEQHGFHYVRTGKHHVLRHANGHSVAIASTPSGGRGDLNKRAEIRRVAKLTKERKK